MFQFFELTEIMRQREDQAFAMALNNMSEGSMSSADIELIKSRETNFNDIPSDCIHLFYSNSDVSVYNTRRLAEIATEEFISTAKDNVKGSSVSERNRTVILEAVKGFKISETQGMCFSLHLKTSAKYMITVNINTADGLVNGATGRLMEIDHQGPERTPVTLWMQFAESEVGAIARSKKPHLHETSWTPIEKVVRTFQYKRNEQVSVERRQFPVIPAEAITIHKSQGATYRLAAVHIKKGMSRSALYVGCSRATKASGLFIVGNFTPPRPFGANEIVQGQLNELRTSKRLETYYKFATERPSSTLLLYYQNIRSFRKHIEDIRSDHFICSSDIICFAETWALREEEPQIEGFSIVARIDGAPQGRQSRPRNGLIIYCKTDLSRSFTTNLDKSLNVDGNVYQFLAISKPDLTIALVYRNPSFSLPTFRRMLEEDVKNMSNQNNGELIVVGDFNICRNTSKEFLGMRLSQLGLHSLLEDLPTTKQQTAIDWLLASFSQDRVKAITYDTPYSDHDGIFLSFSN